MNELPANSADPTARKDEDDKRFSDWKERTGDKVIARETDGQETAPVMPRRRGGGGGGMSSIALFPPQHSTSFTS